jgi:hypothetical protein
MIPGPAREKVDAAPSVASMSSSPVKGLQVTLDWNVTATPKRDWRQFLLLVDAVGEVRAQAEEPIAPGTSTWKHGEVPTALLKLALPRGLQGTFDLRAGLCRDNGRAELEGRGNRELSYFVGRVDVAADGRVNFTGPQSGTGQNLRHQGRSVSKGRHQRAPGDQSRPAGAADRRGHKSRGEKHTLAGQCAKIRCGNVLGPLHPQDAPAWVFSAQDIRSCG